MIDSDDPERKRETDREEYLRRAEANRVRANAKTQAAQECGPLPEVVDHVRRAECEKSLELFARTYFSHVCTLAFAPYHIELMELLERAIHEGIWAAYAVPRGGGKSLISTIAVIWAALTAKRKFPVLLGSTQPKSLLRLRGIKVELQTNPWLYEDFPEVCHPVRSLSRSSRKAEGQRLYGTHTAIEWGKESIRLPVVRYPDGRFAPTSGITICATSITSDLRGLESHTESGQRYRPDFVVADDVQTRESARSAAQSNYRHSILTGDAGYLGGPGVRTSLVCPVTIIYRNDLASRLLDRTISPQFHGVTVPMLRGWPDRMDLWEDYFGLVKKGQLNGEGSTEATEFYRRNQADMDSGCEPTWKERFAEDEISAIQHAMNLYDRDQDSFFSEAQNAPRTSADLTGASVQACTIAQLKQRVRLGTPRKHIPAWATRLVAGVDVQADCLYYMVAAVDDSFVGCVVDYGTLPDQDSTYFRYRDVRKTLADVYPTVARPETRVAHAVRDCVKILANRVWPSEEGGESPLSVSTILVDCGFLPDSVREGISTSGHRSIAYASKGFGCSVKDVPMNSRTIKRGDRRGHNWIFVNQRNQLQFDSYSWKTEIHRSFAASIGDPGSWSVFDGGVMKSYHDMLWDHMTSEVPTTVSTDERTVVEWAIRPGNPDNHLLDCLVMCGVAASVGGSQVEGAWAPIESGEPTVIPKPRKKVKYIQF